MARRHECQLARPETLTTLVNADVHPYERCTVSGRCRFMSATGEPASSCKLWQAQLPTRLSEMPKLSEITSAQLLLQLTVSYVSLQSLKGLLLGMHLAMQFGLPAHQTPLIDHCTLLQLSSAREGATRHQPNTGAMQTLQHRLQ